MSDHLADAVLAPTGTLALVFTDVQGSTSLWERHTDTMWAALQLHNDLLRAALKEFGGYEVKTEGDAFMVAFSDPLLAVRWCLEVQERLLVADWPETLLSHSDAFEERHADGTLLYRGLRVRMGLHMGEPECRIDPVTGRMDYFGPMVNRAARVGGSGHGGQIVASASIWQAIAPHLLALGDAIVKPLGEHHLKGLDTPESLYQVIPASLGRREFAPLKAQEARKTNLTPSPTTFVGRSRDLQRLHEIFARGDRLVTLLGPGGTGKSRLSIQYGLEHLGDFPQGGVWFCDLTEAHTREAICEAVGRALNVPLTIGNTCDDMVCMLGRSLASHGHMLLIFDNFEQVVDHAAGTIGEWMAAAPDCRFLVSSREVLRLPGETVYELLPLGLPEPGDDVQDSEAVQLFIDRVRSVRHNFELAETDYAAVAEIVRQLDGIPLAIELAAARMGVLSPAKLLERLPRRFDLLASGKRNASERQATLRGLIDWSWNLLQPWEQTALMQCAVFHGGFDMEAAEEVLDLSDHPDAPWALDAIQSLRDKSLLYAYEPRGFEGELRLGMYVSIREYAAEKLAASGLAETTRERHSCYYLGCGGSLAAHINGRGGFERHQRLSLERENLLEILHRALAHRPMDAAHADEALEAMTALDPVLSTQGPMALYVTLLDATLAAALTPGADERLRGRVFDARGRVRRMRGMSAEARSDALQALDIGIEHQDALLQGRSLHMLGLLEQNEGNLVGAREYYDRTIALVRANAIEGFEGLVYLAFGYLHIEEGRLDEAREKLQMALARLVADGNRRFEGVVRSQLGYVLYELGDESAALDSFDQALAASREAQDKRTEGLTLASFADVELLGGRLDEALMHYLRALSLLREVGDRRYEGLYLSRLSSVQVLSGNVAEARQSLDHAQRVIEEVGNPVFVRIQAFHRSLFELAQARLERRSSELAPMLAKVGAAIAEAETPGPDGELPLSIQSDEVRISLRLLKREYEATLAHEAVR